MSSIPKLKAFVQYYRHENDNGLHFWYLTEIQVNEGTTVGDLLEYLVKGEIGEISAYDYLPAVHYSMSGGPGGGIVYCESMSCMLNDVRGDDPQSFIVTYYNSGVPRDDKKAKASDRLVSGDVLVLKKKPTSPGQALLTAFTIESALKMMMDEEKKGLTKEPVFSKEFIDRFRAGKQ